MIANLIALASGIIFAIGLVISGMTNPQKVIGFLDVFGHWDYSLALVMVGAIGVNFFGFKYFSSKKPYCAPKHFLPTKNEIDKRLIAGSALFGIGWGMAGICPGPGIVNLVTNESAAFVFVGSLYLGIIFYRVTEKIFNKKESL